jgi:hypothetical protein
MAQSMISMLFTTYQLRQDQMSYSDDEWEFLGLNLFGRHLMEIRLCLIYYTPLKLLGLHLYTPGFNRVLKSLYELHQSTVTFLQLFQPFDCEQRENQQQPFRYDVYTALQHDTILTEKLRLIAQEWHCEKVTWEHQPPSSSPYFQWLRENCLATMEKHFYGNGALMNSSSTVGQGKDHFGSLFGPTAPNLMQYVPMRAGRNGQDLLLLEAYAMRQHGVDEPMPNVGYRQFFVNGEQQREQAAGRSPVTSRVPAIRTGYAGFSASDPQRDGISKRKREENRRNPNPERSSAPVDANPMDIVEIGRAHV